jgi:hypothetical protein
MSVENSNAMYEVLSPWAEIDPVPLKGIAPRLDGLSGKTIGLFNNGKRAAKPMLKVAERRLKEKIPGIQFKWYEPSQKQQYSNLQMEGASKNDFTAWLNQIDGAITSVGD